MTAHAARAHAALSPSGAHRWIACPGSVRESAGVREKSSVFADEGTAAHTLAELCLREGLDAVDFLGGHVNVNSGKVFRNPGEGDRIFAVDDEMADAVQVYLDEVRRLVAPGDEVEYEAKLDLSHIPGMAFGTGDCVVYKPDSRRLVVADLKYGRGVPVEAEDNPQTRAYALGAAQRFHNRGVDTIENVIVQPRRPHPDGVVRREVIDAVDLLEFRMRLEAAAAATAAPDAPLNPGEWCVFCPAKATCAALRGRVLAAAEMEFADEPPPASTLDADSMAKVLKQADVIKVWLKGVEERAHQMAMDGSPPTGFKLVASRATRRWVDEADAERYLATVFGLTEDQIYAERKIRSPAQMEKVVDAKRKADLAGLIASKSNGTILVPVEDPRPPAKASAEEEFA